MQPSHSTVRRLFHIHFKARRRLRNLIAIAATASAILLIHAALVSATGENLDTSFNYGGQGADDTVYAVAVQPDGKILIGGLFNGYNGNTDARRLVRLNPDGTLDTSFNSRGQGANGGVFAVAVQPDGKIIIGGDFTAYNNDDNASDAILRLNADGTLDTSFNYGSGRGVRNGLPTATVRSVVVQPDGKIIIGGIFDAYNNDDNASDAILRLNADGTLDTSFNYGSGRGVLQILALIHVWVFPGGVSTLALQPDGKILVGGFFSAYNSALLASDNILRLNADSTLDTSFNYGPGAGTNEGGVDNVVAIAVQPDGKIIIGGNFTAYNRDNKLSDCIARLNADGTIDTSFNYGSDKGVAGGGVYSLALQADGKIIIGGKFTSHNGDPNASDFLARLNLDGTLDTSFNYGAGTRGADRAVYAVVLRPDGKILIGGDFTSYNGDPNASNGIARLVTPPGAVSFATDSYSVNEGAGRATITVTRDIASGPASVHYATSDLSGFANCNAQTGNASARCDYTPVEGTLNFAGGESSKSFTIPITNDVYTEGPETLTVTLTNATGSSFLRGASSATVTITDDDPTPGAINPIDVREFFVRQLYLDLLNREPEPSGLAAWLTRLNTCPQPGESLQNCDEIEVASAFFRSPEFFDRGFFLYKFYEAALVRQPQYDEFQDDLRRLTGFLSAAELEQRKQEFAEDFVKRAEFHSLYDSFGSGQPFIDAVLVRAGAARAGLGEATIVTGNRLSVMGRLGTGQITRGEALRELTETPEINGRFYDKAFVVVGYFSLLRRNPDGAYLYWIDQLKRTGDYREMMRGLLQSAEYRSRFGPI